jgi:hypothetical protein
MLFTLFITGDNSVAIYPENDKRKSILKCKRNVEKFELDSQLNWLSRIGDDGYIYLMLADNAYVDKDIDDLRRDLKRISQIFNCSEHSNFEVHMLAGIIDITIKSGQVIEKKG